MVVIAIVAGIAGAMALLLAYAYAIEPRWLRVRHRVVSVHDWPQALDGFTILHVSDLHIRRNAGPPERFLARARGLQADLTVCTGDFIAGPSGLERACAALREFCKGRTVYAAPGNHEYSYYGFRLPGQRWNVKHKLDTGQVFQSLEQAGLRLLVNRRVGIEHNGASFTLAGIGDVFHDAHDLNAALDGARGPVVLLCHSPDLLDEAAGRGVALMLSGHTHGGQARIPFVVTPMTGTRKPLRPPAGIHRRGRTVMHVSPGLGLTFLPLRLFARPEVTLLELWAAKE